MSSRNDRLIADVEKARKRAILYFLLTLTAFVVMEALRGARYWSKVKGEYNLFNYGSSLDYFITAELALLNAMLIAYYDHVRSPGRRSLLWIPWVGIGFAGTYFAADEMLMFHERIGLALERSHPAVLRFFPAGGDTLVTGTYALTAAILAIIFFNRMVTDRRARQYAFAGFGVVSVTAALDIIPKVLWISHVPFRETKELFELLVGWVFGGAFISQAASTFTNTLRLHDMAAQPEGSHGEAAVADSEMPHAA